MRISTLSLLIIGITCGCSKMKHQTTRVNFEVEDVTGVNQMKPFQVALIEESIPLDLRQGPSRTIVELFEPEVGQAVDFELNLKRKDKFGYCLQELARDGVYDTGLIPVLRLRDGGTDLTPNNHNKGSTESKYRNT